MIVEYSVNKRGFLALYRTSLYSHAKLKIKW